MTTPIAPPVSPKVALITGSNRGIGLETARQLARTGVQVVLTARDNASGQQAQAQLQSEGLPVDFHQLDVTDEASVTTACTDLTQKYGKLDILINNGAMYADEDKQKSGLEVSVDTVKNTLDTNVLGPLRVIQAFVPLLKKTQAGIIINLTSGMGQIKNLAAGSLAYRTSKSALNALTKIIADELKNTGIRVNALCPLWVRTAMGGDKGKRSPEEAAAHIVKLALQQGDLPPNGAMVREGKVVDY